MKLTIEKFNEYIDQFVTNVLIANAKPQTKFKFGFLRGTGMLQVNAAQVESMKPLGIVDADGNIDIELLKKAAMSGLDAAGELYVPMLGLHFDRPDFDKFFRLCETGAIS